MQKLLSAFDAAEVKPSEIDIVFSTTVTGLAVPTLEARLATRVGLRPDVKRVPLFGLGCVAGAAGVARMHDYLLAFPDHVSVLLAVELCSLTLQRDDYSIANLVAASLFGDGAGAVVAKGSALTPMGPQVLATRSRIYPDTEEVMGWNIGSNRVPGQVVHRSRDGRREVLGRRCPQLPRRPRPDLRRHLDVGLSSGRAEGDRRRREYAGPSG